SHAVNNLGNHAATALETADRDGNGVSEIVVGTDSGELVILHPLSGQVLETVGSYAGRIDGLAVRDVTGDPGVEYVFAVDGELFVYGSGGSSLLWRSGWLGDIAPPYEAHVGWADGLMVADIDLDGRPEIVIGCGITGFRVFEVPPSTVVSVSDAAVTEG